MERSNKLVEQALIILREHSQFQISQDTEQSNVANEVLSYHCIYIKLWLVIIIIAIVVHIEMNGILMFKIIVIFLQNDPQYLPSHDMLLLLTNFIALPASGTHEVSLQVNFSSIFILSLVCINKLIKYAKFTLGNSA